MRPPDPLSRCRAPKRHEGRVEPKPTAHGWRALTLTGLRPWTLSARDHLRRWSAAVRSLPYSSRRRSTRCGGLVRSMPPSSGLPIRPTRSIAPSRSCPTTGETGQMVVQHPHTWFSGLSDENRRRRLGGDGDERTWGSRTLMRSSFWSSMSTRHCGDTSRIRTTACGPASSTISRTSCRATATRCAGAGIRHDRRPPGARSTIHTSPAVYWAPVSSGARPRRPHGPAALVLVPRSGVPYGDRDAQVRARLCRGRPDGRQRLPGDRP